MYEEAREEKRLSTVHRRRARQRMEELRAFCAAHGIELVEYTKAEAQTSHGRQQEVEARAS
jgi:predicted site-specific integrase-resolvase